MKVFSKRSLWIAFEYLLVAGVFLMLFSRSTPHQKHLRTGQTPTSRSQGFYVSPQHVRLPATGESIPLEIRDSAICIYGAKAGSTTKRCYQVDTGLQNTIWNVVSPLPRPGPEDITMHLTFDGCDRKAVKGLLHRDQAFTFGEVRFLGVDGTDFCPEKPRISSTDIEYGGCVGLAMFSDVLVTFDLAHNLMTIAGGDLPASNGEDVLDLTVTRDPFLQIAFDATLGDRKIKFVVDSGASGPTDITVPDNLVPPISAVEKFPAEQHTWSGDSRSGEILFTKDELRFGKYKLPATTVFQGPRSDSACLMGTTLFQNFVVTLDVANGRMRLVPSEGVDVGNQGIELGKLAFESPTLNGSVRNVLRTECPDDQSGVLPLCDVKVKNKCQIVNFYNGRFLFIQPDGLFVYYLGPNSGFSIAADGSVEVASVKPIVSRWYEPKLPSKSYPHFLKPDADLLNCYTDQKTHMKITENRAHVRVVQDVDGSSSLFLPDSNAEFHFSPSGTLKITRAKAQHPQQPK